MNLKALMMTGPLVMLAFSGMAYTATAEAHGPVVRVVCDVHRIDHDIRWLNHHPRWRARHWRRWHHRPLPVVYVVRPAPRVVILDDDDD